MSIQLGCIADDYTGASDLANMLRRNGLRTVQTIGVPRPGLDLPEVDAVVVSLKSRSIEAARAVELSLEAEAWLRERGAEHVLFKVCSTFDSTDAGNIGPVTDALRARAGCGAVLVNPAFPETGRSVFQGNLFVNGVPLNESPLKDHPLNPMRDANLVRVLQRQSASGVGLVPYAVVEQGVAAVRAALADASARGEGSVIADAVAARHLDVLGEAALADPLSTGASGLGAGIARALVARGPQRTVSKSPADVGMSGQGSVAAGSRAAILAGSCSAATRRQIAVAEAAGIPIHRLDVSRLLEGGASLVVAEALAWAHARLDAGPVLIASSDTPDAVAAMQRSHGGAAAGHVVEQALADIAEALVAASVRRLVVAGGETSGAVVDRLGLEAFLIGREIAPGVPALRTAGAHHAGLAVALKSGNFGGDDFFAEALSMLNQTETD
ncbi:3-oxo-tetronate kinase [Lichenicola sp.]|uniref:3-oxo-tetronate kinase n=1 Tax=Lichenicola sp. TaxID=2804529 RepID=UPI003B00141E